MRDGAWKGGVAFRAAIMIYNRDCLVSDVQY